MLGYTACGRDVRFYAVLQPWPDGESRWDPSYMQLGRPVDMTQAAGPPNALCQPPGVIPVQRLPLKSALIWVKSMNRVPMFTACHAGALEE